MLTLILLGLLGGSGWYGVRQRKRARKAEAQLKRIACTDDEVMAVLEASSGSLAKRLLLEARAETGKALTEDGWRALVADLKSYSGENYKFHALHGYVGDGLLVTEEQYLKLVKMFDEVFRPSVRALLKTSRTALRRRA
jgi:hypothetical protein